MFRVPKSFIFLFVGLSILTAFAIHLFLEPDSGQASLQSSEFSSLDRLRAVTSLRDANPHRIEIEKCHCTNGNVQIRDFEYEDPAQCSSSRRTYEEAFHRSSPLFRGERAKSAAEFPKLCLTYILNRSRKSDGERRTSQNECGIDPQPICATAVYVTTLYNYFMDIADCLEIPQRDFLPKFFLQSGLQMNALGPKAAAGISFLTPTDVLNANKNFEIHKAQILNSQKESCARIAKDIKGFSPLLSGSDGGPVCGLMNPENNPLINFFYLSMKYLNDREVIRNGIQHFEIVERLAKLGLSSSDDDREQIMQIIDALALDSNAEEALSHLNLYLQHLESTTSHANRNDFDFSKLDIDQAEGKASGRQKLSFVAFIRERAGTKALQSIQQLRDKALQLNQVFKPGTCVPHSYLSL